MNRLTIDVELDLLPTTDGGRSAPLMSGYRSLLRFDGTNLDVGFEIKLEPEQDPVGLAPGASGRSQLSLWATEDLPVLIAGMQFEVREGIRVVGRGVIVDVQRVDTLSR